MRTIYVFAVILCTALVFGGCGKAELYQKKPPRERNIADYVIVRSETASICEVRGAILLRDKIYELSGVKLPIVKDGSEAREKEIVVGKTKRKVDSLRDGAEIGSGGYLITSLESSYLVFGGGDGIYDGVEYFVFSLINDGDGNLFLPEDISVKVVADAVAETEISETPQTVAP